MILLNPFLRWMSKFYGYFILIGSNLQSLFLLYMRFTWGHQTILGGLAKLKDIDSYVQLLTTFNYPAPRFHAYEIAYIELICGFLLLIGFASRLVAIPLIILSLTSLTTIHADYLTHFRFITEPLMLVIQQPYPFLITALLIFIFGPGRISVDAWIKRWLDSQPHY